MIRILNPDGSETIVPRRVESMNGKRHPSFAADERAMRSAVSEPARAGEYLPAERAPVPSWFTSRASGQSCLGNPPSDARDSRASNPVHPARPAPHTDDPNVRFLQGVLHAASERRASSDRQATVYLAIALLAVAGIAIVSIWLVNHPAPGMHHPAPITSPIGKGDKLAVRS